MPFNAFVANAATNLIDWTKLIGFTDHPDLTRCEIETFRYRVLYVVARLTRGARQLHLRIERHLALGQSNHGCPAADPRCFPINPLPLFRRDERPFSPKGSPPTGTTPDDLSYPPAPGSPPKVGVNGGRA